MLSKAPVTTILPVIDMNRAREFYEHKLGLNPVGFATPRSGLQTPKSSA